MIRPFDLVVFDFDGTLVQSNGVKNDGFDRLAELYSGGDAAMKIARDDPTRDRFSVADRFAKALGLDAARGPEIAAQYGDIVDQAVIEAPECPGAVGLLEALQASDMAVHLSSATPKTALEHIVRARNWMPFFDGIHGRPATKEDTLAQLIAKTGTKPSRIVVIGDGPDDRKSAKELGTAFFAVGDRLTEEVLMTLSDVRDRLLC
ncbi:MAG: HAD family hydrolase [Pseudomonadota bacterium]